jgi:YspA, cpYpsA-related SLOG family
MKLAIVGSRGFKSLELVGDFVRRLKPDTVVVSGGAVGVDQYAVSAASRLGHLTEVFPPDWKQHGTAAGPIRNRQMIATVDGLIAFWNGKSAGTFNAIQEAANRRIWLRVVYPNSHWVQCYDEKGVFISDLK